MIKYETQKEKTFYTDILELLPEAVSYAEPIFGDNDTIIDFSINYSNKKADEYSGNLTGTLVGCRVLHDAIPDKRNSYANFLNLLEVYETGESKEIRFDLSHSSFIYLLRRKFKDGVLTTAVNRRELLEAEEKERNKTRLLNNVIQNFPIGVIVYDSIRDDAGQLLDFKVKVFNQKINDITGITSQQRSTLTLKSILKITGGEKNFGKYQKVVETGESVFTEYFCNKLKLWLSFSLVKLDDGFLGLIADVSESKKVQKAIEEQSLYLNSILDASLNGVFTLKAIIKNSGEIIDFEFVQVNKSLLEMANATEEEMKGKTVLQLYPDSYQSGLFDLYTQVITTGMAIRKEICYNQSGSTRWLDVAAVKLSENELVVTYSDITVKKHAELEIEKQKGLLDKILKNSSSGISVTQVIRNENNEVIDGKTIIYNDAALKYTGFSKEDLDTKTVNEIVPGIINSPLYQLSLSTLQTGEQFQTQYYLENTERWLELSVSKLDSNNLINIFTDITNAKIAQIEVERSAKTLKDLIDTAGAGMSLLRPLKDQAETVVDFIFDVTNNTLAGYANKSPEEITGKKVSETFPSYYKNGLFGKYRQAYETGDRNKFEFEYQEDNINRWFEVMVTRMGENILVSVNDLTHIKRLQFELEKTVDHLRRSNENLKEFAYAASHDLQEPLRKISYFADRLKQKSTVSEDDKGMFDRMMSATKRMNTLIEDLLNYSRVNVQNDSFEELALDDVLHDVLDNLEASIQEKQATFNIDKLPVVNGNRQQLRQLFQNVVSNSIKYAKPGIPPHINITVKKVTARESGAPVPQKSGNELYNLIEVSDNGIGFDQEYSEKIFKVFQRLHGRSEYSGTGVGLAIVRKVVEYHNGYITAYGETGKGATFKIYLPALT